MVNIAEYNAEQRFYSDKGHHMLQDLAYLKQGLTSNQSFGGFDYDAYEEIIMEVIKERSN